MSKVRLVEFYRTADGSKPVAEWMDTLDEDQAQAVAMGIKFFEEFPGLTVPSSRFEKVSGHIWELRLHHGKEQFRLYAFKDEALIIAAVGLTKKWRKARSSELALAEKRRKDYFTRKKVAPRVLQKKPPRQVEI